MLTPTFACSRRYREEWGDCLVPRRYWGDWRLGEWVADARQAYKEKRLTRAQVTALEALGFPWKVPQVRGGPYHRPFPCHCQFCGSRCECLLAREWQDLIQHLSG